MRNFLIEFLYIVLLGIQIAHQDLNEDLVIMQIRIAQTQYPMHVCYVLVGYLLCSSDESLHLLQYRLWVHQRLGLWLIIHALFCSDRHNLLRCVCLPLCIC